MKKPPDLHFLESTDESGFSSVKISSFRERSPSAIVRELVQNSLDAAVAGPGNSASVRFIVDKRGTKDIPGIKSYRQAFRRAVNYRKKGNNDSLPDQEKIIVERIEAALKKDIQDILIVEDNGAGLNNETMKALLSDGISRKPGTSAGAFGNGHFAVFPISDLRYLLYGGVHNGRRIASGHAILASHVQNNKDHIGRSANGYYIADNKGRAHIYPDNHQIPELIATILERIEKNEGHGTAVIVPAFNYFNDDQSGLHHAIKQAAACSFFAAIDAGELDITVEDSRGQSKSIIDSNNLNETLTLYEEQRRNRDFLSGYKANSAYTCLQRGELHEVSVLDGRVSIYILKGQSNTRINLCRNGMWITNNDRSSGGIPGFYQAFAGHEAFEALILVSAEHSPRFHELIRNAEGPLHNRLDTDAMKREDARALRATFSEIKKFIKQQVPEVSDDPYRPYDILSFPGNDAGGVNESGQTYANQGILTPLRRNARPGRLQTNDPQSLSESRLGSKSGGNKPDPKRKSTSGRKRILPENFTTVATPQGRNRQKLTIQCLENCRNMQLHLVLNENTDATTDRIWKEETVTIIKAKVNGKKVSKKYIIDGSYPGLRIGDLESGSSTEIEVEYVYEAADTVLVDSSLCVVIQETPAS